MATFGVFCMCRNNWVAFLWKLIKKLMLVHCIVGKYSDHIICLQILFCETALDLTQLSRRRPHTMWGLSPHGAVLFVCLFLPPVLGYEVGFRCGQVTRTGNKVVGGTTASAHEYPWQVRWFSRFSLINEEISILPFPGSFGNCIFWW